MDIKINELSAKTFNWLGMNESVVKDVPEFECGSMVVTTPDEVTCERELVDSIALSGIDKETSGMGRDIDELISFMWPAKKPSRATFYKGRRGASGYILVY